MNLSELLSDRERAAFAGRQDAIRQTFDAFGFQKDQLVLFGGAALALHGINASMNTGFDLDAFAQRDMILALREWWPEYPQLDDNAVELPAFVCGNALPFTGLHKEPEPAGDTVWENIFAHSEPTPDGYFTLPVDMVVQRKLKVDRDKDMIGLVQAHLLKNQALARGEPVHPYLLTDSWLVAALYGVIQLGMISSNHSEATPDAESLPQWVYEISGMHFEHPLLADVYEHIETYGLRF